MTQRLVEVLTESRNRGFLGPGPVQRHLDHAAAFAAAIIDPPTRSLDLGAGGGLPGLVLAATVWPRTRWTFLDAQARRTEFLEEAVTALGLGERVSVRTERAEATGHDPAHRGAYELVVSRSFAIPAVTAECAAPLLEVGGHLVVSEPPAADLDVRWPAEPLARLGLGVPEALVVPTPSDAVHLVRIECVELSPATAPRRVGIPGKRPLWSIT